ncbi:MAG: LysR family transcriptional regulator [Pseudomonadota bacterium]
MQDIDWHDLRFVLAVAREGALAGAARRLGVNETTVARRLARLEGRLGARLFERGQSRLTSTAAGQAAVDGAERIELQIQALADRVAGSDRLAAGTVRVTSVPVLVNRLLIPALPGLLARHPQLRVELIAEPRDLSLTKREADVALRLARPRKDSRAIARRIGQLAYGVYGPAGGDAGALPWVTYEDAMAELPQARWMAARPGQPAPLLVNDAEGVLQAVAAGLGKSLLPISIADPLPGLTRLDAGAAPLTRELWRIVHPELRDLTRIRVVLDWLDGLAGQLAEAES